MSVAESIVIFGPICQVGCLRASSGVTSSSCLRVRPRNGPPEDVRITRRTSRAAPALSAWKIAECSLSTGRICVPRDRASSMTSGPATTSVSLLARATVLPASSAAQVPRRPTAPDDRAQARGRSRGPAPSGSMPSSPASTCDARAAQLALEVADSVRISHRDESRPQGAWPVRPAFASGSARSSPRRLSRLPAVVLDHAQGASPDRARRAQDHDMSEPSTTIWFGPSFQHDGVSIHERLLHRLRFSHIRFTSHDGARASAFFRPAHETIESRAPGHKLRCDAGGRQGTWGCVLMKTRPFGSRRLGRRISYEEGRKAGESFW